MTGKKIEVAKHNKSQGSDNISDRSFIVDIQTMDKMNPSISPLHHILFVTYKRTWCWWSPKLIQLFASIIINY